jgi:hypothetical protein
MDDLDGLPVINVSTAPCGSASNPHVVRSPTTLACEGCGAGLASILLARAVAALAPVNPGEPMGKVG